MMKAVLGLTTAETDKLFDELDMLAGRGKHNNPGNICWGDGIFAQSLVKKYGMSIAELERVKRFAKPCSIGAGKPKPGEARMKADIKFLILQLRTIEHAQDHDGIEAVRKRYNIRRL